ncbi:hypothetical protein A2U01_0022262 [Trifolium medium]|uniref:Uncharacterized protein n=1 Tax=Trifolium medium TaxID=97028 RepID=A0A392NMY8_9FABA|nr:hypothetical protein [Trifolium medium]
MGEGHSVTFQTSWTTEVPNCGGRLFHKMDQSKSSGKHYWRQHHQVLRDKHPLPFRGTPSRGHRQRYLVHTDKKMRQLLAEYNIKHHFTSVEHPRPMDKRKPQTR